MKLSDRRIVGGVLALMFVVSIAQSGAILRILNTLNGENQTAQVKSLFGTTNGASRYVFGPEHNGQSFSFKGNTLATIVVCGGGGGGGGGFSYFSWGTDGGGGGGGGAMGQCQTIKRKFRTSDVLTWSIGNGGAGGIGGLTLADNQQPVQTHPTMGQSGGTTRLYINGVTVAEGVGGNGGYPPSSDFVGSSTGGNGGSLLYGIESWHKGQAGSLSGGGAGGKGETNALYGGGNGGAGGTSGVNDAFGRNGLAGYPTFGGGGGGGAAQYFQVEQVISKEGEVSRGGNGGNGGNGQVIIVQ